MGRPAGLSKVRGDLSKRDRHVVRRIELLDHHVNRGCEDPADTSALLLGRERRRGFRWRGFFHEGGNLPSP
jgi:hypothetical protein